MHIALTNKKRCSSYTQASFVASYELPCFNACGCGYVSGAKYFRESNQLKEMKL